MRAAVSPGCASSTRVVAPSALSFNSSPGHSRITSASSRVLTMSSPAWITASCVTLPPSAISTMRGSGSDTEVGGVSGVGATAAELTRANVTARAIARVSVQALKREQRGVMGLPSRYEVSPKIIARAPNQAPGRFAGGAGKMQNAES